MSVTWGDIKRKVRYKGNYDENQEAENEFMYVDAANEALSHLQHDCPKIGTITIPIHRIHDMLYGHGRMIRFQGNPISFTVTAPKCLRYNVIGKCYVTYAVNNSEIATFLAEGWQTDTTLNVNCTDKFTIKFTPFDNRAFIIADLGIFDELDFNGGVPQNTPYFHYDLSALVSDFLELAPEEKEPVRMFCPPYGHVPASDYRIERDKDLYINACNEGIYELSYHKRLAHTLIGSSTADSAAIDLDDTQIELLVAYMAYEVEKYNDIQIAYTYLNDYNSQLAAYMNRPRVNDVPVVINTKGWW